MHDDLRLLATANGGYLHRSDLLSLGESDKAIRAATRAGALRRIRVGTFVLPDMYEPLDPTERHLVLARSVADKFEPGSIALSHHSAAAAMGIGLFGVDLSRVHVTRLDTGAGRSEAGVHHHRALPGDHVVDADGGRLCVSASSAVWQLACTHSRRSGLVAMDSALNLGLMTHEELIDAAGRFTCWPGARGARLTARLADGGAESPPETLYRYVCIEHHLPRPVTQFVVTRTDGSFVARADLGFPDHCHVAEMDGVAKYIRHLRDGESSSDAVVREKVREDQIRAQQLGVSRAMYVDVMPSASRRCASALAHDLEQSDRLYRRARRHFA